MMAKLTKDNFYKQIRDKLANKSKPNIIEKLKAVKK